MSQTARRSSIWATTGRGAALLLDRTPPASDADRRILAEADWRDQQRGSDESPARYRLARTRRPGTSLRRQAEARAGCGAHDAESGLSAEVAGARLLEARAVLRAASDEQCLLGRSPRFPPGMYSTLAGFVEPGESLEDTLRREVREETGIELAAVRYRASQPWPFPQSLMLGFRARAASTAIRIDPEELEDARWFRRAELGDPARRPVRLPAQDSIARFLIDEWLAEG